jgi:predicted flap endonuclease-1-like 5' DNA nuclease
VSDTTPTTLPTVTKKDAEAAKKAAKKAADAAKKAAKKDHVNGHDLKQILGDSSLVDNGGHKWG